MALTPASANTPYLAAARLWLYRDERPVLELLTDDDAPATRPDAEDATTDPGARLLAALKAASGQVDARCLVGKRYQPADLAALTGNGLGLLEQLVADLCVWGLARRRWPRVKPDDVSGAVQALDTLKDLASGEQIFGLVEAAAAGLPEVNEPVVANQLGPVRAVTRATRLYGSAAQDNPIYGDGRRC